MRTIMLCLNQVGIGGVETAVLNQTIQLQKDGNQVIIIAKDGIYRDEFEKRGAIFEEFEFKVQNQYDMEKINKIIDIVEKYKVDQVYIEQFDCINTVVPACILKNIPYVAYLHTGITGTYDWFENSFPGYKYMFEMCFKSAEKIIAITEQAMQENKSRYNIPNDKYLIKKNSIDFDEISTFHKKLPKKIEKFLIISRMSNEKMLSIKNSISVFREYYKKYPNTRLTIVGNGEYRQEIEEDVKDIKQAVEFLGQRNDILSIISEHDIVLGLDRCILETIAMKKIALISGYEGIKIIVTPDIIEKASDNNFSGWNLENKGIPEIIDQIKGLNKRKIKNIVEKNYKFAFENLNISKNIYIIEDVDKSKLALKPSDAIRYIIELQNMYSKNIKYTDDLYKECKKTQYYLEEKIEIITREKERLEGEIRKLREKKDENFTNME